MAFRRDVPSLQTLIYKAISKYPVSKVISPKQLEKLHSISEPHKGRTHKVKQELVRTLLSCGRLNDDTLPKEFFDSSWTKFEVIGGRIADKFIELLTQNCPNLTTLNFSGCFRLTDAHIEILLRRCPNLKDLCLENCRKLSDQSLIHLVQLGHKLTAIDIGGNFNMTINGIMHLVENHENRSKFTKLHLSGHDISERELQIITSKCRKLHSLALGYTSIGDDAIIALLERRKSIVRLHLHWSQFLTDKLLYHLADHCPNIQDINLCGVKSLSSQALSDIVHKKMQLADTPVTEGTHPPKRLKKVDFKYTSISKEMSTTIQETYPNLKFII